MDAKYILGIPEIDAQHEELHELVNSLREVISNKDQRHLVHQAMKRLHHLLVTHFAFEDAFMKMIDYPDLPQHKKMHKGVLTLFENFDHPPEPGDYEILGKMTSFRCAKERVRAGLQPVGESIAWSADAKSHRPCH